MHECLLCERDMKKSKDIFGSGCTNNIFKFLNIEKPTRCKNKEQLLYKNIMKITNVSKINNNQKIWLTDRYLTYQYLNQLHYGDFENLKKQLRQDIENIDKVEEFDKLITARKIKLKEAYDLYKRERKFETSLNKVKDTENYKEDEKIKLLISGFSYIFNMYQNKNQYNKNSLKAMQYAFWQTVIEVGGRYFNYELAAILLQHSLEENPQDFVIKDEQLLEMIRRDSNSSWSIDITLSDTFDFTKWKTPLEYYFDANNIPKSILSSTLYNLAFISQKLGVIKEYKVIAKLSIKLQENGEIENL